LPITALRVTPISAAISLQVMPAATQLRSCSMRCAVQVGLEVVMLFGVLIGGAAIGAVALVAIAVTGRFVDGIGSDGAIDARVDESVMDGLAVAAAVLGRRQGDGRAQPATARRQNLEAKIGAGAGA
jgi:hypothetical protein